MYTWAALLDFFLFTFLFFLFLYFSDDKVPDDLFVKKQTNKKFYRQHSNL